MVSPDVVAGELGLVDVAVERFCSWVQIGAVVEDFELGIVQAINFLPRYADPALVNVEFHGSLMLEGSWNNNHS